MPAWYWDQGLGLGALAAAEVWAEAAVAAVEGDVGMRDQDGFRAVDMGCTGCGLASFHKLGPSLGPVVLPRVGRRGEWEMYGAQ